MRSLRKRDSFLFYGRLTLAQITRTCCCRVASFILPLIWPDRLLGRVCVFCTVRIRVWILAFAHKVREWKGNNCLVSYTVTLGQEKGWESPFLKCSPYQKGKERQKRGKGAFKKGMCHSPVQSSGIWYLEERTTVCTPEMTWLTLTKGYPRKLNSCAIVNQTAGRATHNTTFESYLNSSLTDWVEEEEEKEALSFIFEREGPDFTGVTQSKERRKKRSNTTYSKKRETHSTIWSCFTTLYNIMKFPSLLLPTTQCDESPTCDVDAICWHRGAAFVFWFCPDLKMGALIAPFLPSPIFGSQQPRMRRKLKLKSGRNKWSTGALSLSLFLLVLSSWLRVSFFSANITV